MEDSLAKSVKGLEFIVKSSDMKFKEDVDHASLFTAIAVVQGVMEGNGSLTGTPGYDILKKEFDYCQKAIQRASDNISEKSFRKEAVYQNFLKQKTKMVNRALADGMVPYDDHNLRATIAKTFQGVPEEEYFKHLENIGKEIRKELGSMQQDIDHNRISHNFIKELNILYKAFSNYEH